MLVVAVVFVVFAVFFCFVLLALFRFVFVFVFVLYCSVLFCSVFFVLPCTSISLMRLFRLLSILCCAVLLLKLIRFTLFSVDLFSICLHAFIVWLVLQTNAEQEKEAGMVSVDEELRDNSVPMCLSGFDEKGLFEANGKEACPLCEGVWEEER